MKKYVRWGIVGAVVAGLAGLGIHTFTPRPNEELEEQAGGPAPEGKQAARGLNVRAVTVKRQTLDDNLLVSGVLLPDEEVELSFETSGKITGIHFVEGAEVKRGQLLAKVNDAPLQAELRKLQSQLKLAGDRVYRQNALLEKEAVSREAFQEAQTNLATLHAEIDMIRANIDQTELRAPFDGVIGLRQVSQGAYASPSTVVATLTKIQPLKVEFSVPERYAGLLKPGAGLSFRVEGEMDAFGAQVYATDSRVDAETHTYTIRARYPNAGGRLMPGRFVNVELEARQYENTLAVPSEAIVSEMGVDKVFLYKGGVAQPAEITKGLRTESQVQVLRGVSAGDTVIVSGTMQLRTGQRVTLDSVD